MGNRIAWPIIHLVQRVSMILTLGCCIYLIFFLLFKTHDNSISVENNNAPLKDTDLVSPTPVLSLKSNTTSVSVQARDIFSLSGVGPSGALENTPKGQLPAHLKVVAILIANPSQIVIEDTYAKKTYFVDEDHPQNGIKIARVSKKQIVINYQGQEITVPVMKN